MRLLTREEFKKQVFARDKNKCVVCGAAAVDSHHIIDRKAFSDGGYYIANGVAVCDKCHLRAERMDISTDELRRLAGIREIILPPGLVGPLDKWANRIREDGSREPGPLFNDDGFRKICKHLLHIFVVPEEDIDK